MQDGPINQMEPTMQTQQESEQSFQITDAEGRSWRIEPVIDHGDARCSGNGPMTPAAPAPLATLANHMPCHTRSGGLVTQAMIDRHGSYRAAREAIDAPHQAACERPTITEQKEYNR